MKVKPIKAIAVASKKRPKLDVKEIYDLNDEVNVDDDEKIIKVEIHEV